MMKNVDDFGAGWFARPGFAPATNDSNATVVAGQALLGIWDLTFTSGGSGELSLDAQSFSCLLSDGHGHWGDWAFSPMTGGYPAICTRRRGTYPARVYGPNGHDLQCPVEETWHILSFSGDMMRFSTGSAARRSAVPMPVVSARILQVQTNLQLADMVDRDVAALEQGLVTPTAPPPAAWQDGTPHLSSIAMRSANVLFALNRVEQELNKSLTTWRYEPKPISPWENMDLEMSRQIQCGSNVVKAIKWAISCLGTLAPEAKTLAGYGAPKPNELLGQRLDNYQKILSITSQTLQNSISTAQKMMGISAGTQTAIMESMQAINEGWRETFGVKGPSWAVIVKR